MSTYERGPRRATVGDDKSHVGERGKRGSDGVDELSNPNEGVARAVGRYCKRFKN
jgi:hypothetical protein